MKSHEIRCLSSIIEVWNIFVSLDTRSFSGGAGRAIGRPTIYAHHRYLSSFASSRRKRISVGIGAGAWLVAVEASDAAAKAALVEYASPPCFGCGSEAHRPPV